MDMPTDRTRGRLPGWKALLVRDETFRRLQLIQQASVDPYLDLRYLGDAALLLALEEQETRSIVRRACDEIRRFL
jgi:hypothetical protein